MESLSLLNADQVRELIQNSARLLARVDFATLAEGRDDPNHDLFLMAREGLRCALTCASVLRDPTLLASVIQALNASERWWSEHGDGLDRVALKALREVLGALQDVDAGVVELVEHERAEVREVVARELKPYTQWAREQLELLGHDVLTSIRKPAQEKLRKLGEVPVWWGIFDSDPVPRLSPRQASPQGKRIVRIVQAFDLHEELWTDNHWFILVEHLRALPEPLGAEVAERLLRAKSRRELRASLFSVVFLRQDAEAALGAWLVRWSQSGAPPKGTRMLGEGVAWHPRRAIKLRAQLFAWLRSRERPAGSGESFRKLAAEVLGYSWPAGLDPTPLLDLMLELPADDGAHALDEILGHILEQMDSLPDVLLKRAVEAQQQGFPRNWARLQQTFERIIERLSPRKLRPLARQALSSPNEQVVSWALRQLLTELHRTSQDGSRLGAIHRFWKDARLRSVLAKRHTALVLPLLRRELRANQLSLPEACLTMACIKTFYGGFAPSPDRSPRTPAQESASRREEREKVRDLLGPPSLRGPPTREEWAAFRTLRDRDAFAESKKDEQYNFSELEIAPPGKEWHPADRAFFTRAIKWWFETRNERLNLQLLRAIATKPVRDDMFILEQLLQHADANGRRLGEQCRAIARKSLGLDVEPPEPSSETIGG
jgi:hypothetical protein